MENNQRHYYSHQQLLLHHHQQKLQEEEEALLRRQLQKLQQEQEQQQQEVLRDYSFEDFADYYPPGYRFRPTDEELVSKYLVELMHGNHHHDQQPLSKQRRKHTIREVDIYKGSPEAITSEYPLGAVNMENEWYFITPLERKYPKGGRPSRTCMGSGFWKPTGKDKKIKVDNVVARKKCLEYFKGKPPGKKTDWKMHEYRIENLYDSTAAPRQGELKKKQLCRALCRIYLNKRKKDKKGDDEKEESLEEPGMMNEIDNTSETDSNLVVNGGGDANASQVLYGSAGLNPDHYLPSPSELVNFFDYGAFDPYYANDTALYNFNNQEFVNQVPFGYASNLSTALPYK